MKPQDIIFIFLLLGLLFFRKPRWFVIAGIALLILSIPLFEFWIFFTAQRFVWYAAAFFLTAILLELYEDFRSSGKK